MIKLVFKYKWYILIILALIIVEPSLNSILNFWLQRMFNTAQPGADKLVLIRLLTIGFLLWILKRVVLYTSGLIKARFICNAKQDIKHRMFVSIMKLNTSNISAEVSSGEYISLFTNDITLLENKFFEQVIGLIGGIFSIVIMGTSFLRLNVRLASCIIGFGVLSMFVPFFFSKKLNEKSLIFSNKISAFTQRMKEYMVAYPTIKNYSIEQTIADKFDEINQGVEDAKFEMEYSLTLANNVGQLLSWFMQFIGVGLGLIMVANGQILVGTVIAAQGFASDLALPLQGIIFNVNAIRSVKEIVKKIEKTAQIRETEQEEKERERKEKSGEETANRFAGMQDCKIVFDDLSLEIGGTQIIKNFSFTFENRKKYLIVGLNGSGKTTLFKLVKKWFKKYTGTIRINDVDIRTMQSEEVSHIVSFLNENVSLFSGTVKDNIRLFREADDEVFSDAVDAAQIKIDLDRTIIDEGRNISSGEQRRIEIARSLIEPVSVLIFDEVVSTLDIETAYEIEKLALGFEDKTLIFISHNFSGKLIREYDEILVMANGSLLAHGSYQELIESCEYFRRICDIKFGKIGDLS